MKYKATIRNADYFGFDPIEFDFPCTIDFTRFGNTVTPVTNILISTHVEFDDMSTYKVFVCSNEPSTSINREHNRSIILNAFQYDMILTTEEEVIDQCDNAYFFPYGGTWLNKKKDRHPDSLGEFDESILDQVKDKQFNVSFLTTSHLGKSGYTLRQQIWNNKDKIKVPTLFYSSTRFKTNSNSFVGMGKFSDTLHDGLLPNDDKINLFKSHFSIAVESSRENSYFTEKLIDCLLTKTVPIYWGCPNIGELGFDSRGIIHFKSFNEMMEKINQIDENTYENMKPYIEHNYNVAKEYGRSFFTRIQEIVNKNYNLQKENTNMLWTIGILTLPHRKQFLDKLLWLLNYTMPYGYAHRIEIMINEDDGTKTVGQKRNEILDTAKGKYVSFIDDDDLVQLAYLSKISMKLNKEIYDAIGFWGMYYVSGNPVMKFNHANINGGHFKKNGHQFRPLNHLNPVLTKIAKKIRFPEKNFAEDADYCDRMLESQLVKEEYVFNEIMYHYLFDPKTTETQK